jgi:hypothetical protein
MDSNFSVTEENTESTFQDFVFKADQVVSTRRSMRISKFNPIAL